MLRTLLVLLLLSTPASAQKLEPEVPEGLELFGSADATMNAAIAQAQSTLPLFLSYVLDAQGMSREGSIKVSFQTFPVDQGAEVIWVTAFRRLPDGSYTGRLNNQPFHLGNWQMGDSVSFPASAIQDWSLRTADGSYGNYTTRIIAAQPGNEVFAQGLTPDPLPANWR